MLIHSNRLKICSFKLKSKYRVFEKNTKCVIHSYKQFQYY